MKRILNKIFNLIIKEEREFLFNSNNIIILVAYLITISIYIQLKINGVL